MPVFTYMRASYKVMISISRVSIRYTPFTFNPNHVWDSAFARARVSPRPCQVIIEHRGIIAARSSLCRKGGIRCYLCA